jgi:hypothetical protein
MVSHALSDMMFCEIDIRCEEIEYYGTEAILEILK